MLNQVTLMGRLTTDPTLRQTETGRDVSNITLACNRNYTGQDGHAAVDYIDAVVWGGLAQTVFYHLSKGDLVVLEGHLRQIKRQDSAGNNIFQLQLTADKVHFAARKRGTQYAESLNYPGEPSSAPTSVPIGSF